MKTQPCWHVVESLEAHRRIVNGGRNAIRLTVHDAPEQMVAAIGRALMKVNSVRSEWAFFPVKCALCDGGPLKMETNEIRILAWAVPQSD